MMMDSILFINSVLFYVVVRQDYKTDYKYEIKKKRWKESLSIWFEFVIVVVVANY